MNTILDRVRREPALVTGLVGAPIFLLLLGRRHYTYSGGGE